MKPARRASDLGIQISDFMIDVVKTILASLILHLLRKLAKYASPMARYQLALLQWKWFYKLARLAAISAILQPAVEDSRLAPLGPLFRLYVRSAIPMACLQISRYSPQVLASIAQHRTSDRQYPLSVATNFAQALVQDSKGFSKGNISRYGFDTLTTFLSLGTFALASRCVVEATPELDSVLARMRNRVTDYFENNPKPTEVA